MNIPRLLPDLIDLTAGRAPDRPAMRFPGRSTTYAELSTRSNQLAQALREAGVKRGDRVGIFTPKCPELGVAMHGIMKAGAAYVPVDPTAPLERQAFMIRDCGLDCLITGDRQHDRLAELEATGLSFAGLFGLSGADDIASPSFPWESLETITTTRPEGETSPDDLAYIIYTSGSTGTPKGIMHTHASGMAFATWAAEAYGLTGDDCLSNHAPLHFDLSIFDYFAGAAAGATTLIIPEAYTKLAASYTQLLQDEQVSVLFTVPFAMIQMLSHGVLQDRDLSALRWAIFGGEPFPPKYLRALMKRLPRVRFDNMYGPAEINGCSHFTLPAPPEDDHEPIPIGPLNPICNGLIVGPDDLPVELGETGELLVRTPTMMRGYWQRPDLNANAFFRPPDDRNAVYYRTGDLVRSDSGEILTFVGRADRQVKSRGYRVELDEVESAIVSHDAVAEAAAYVVAIEGESRIEAAVTLKDGLPVEVPALSTHAKSRLPWYAVPATILLETELPRTPTGKIDRRALQSAAMARLAAPGESVLTESAKTD